MPAHTITLLPPASGSFERVVAAVNNLRLDEVRALAERLRTLWDPWRCPAAELPMLAWAFSVDYWDPAWSVPRQRRVIAEARLYHRRKTTVAGVRMALGYRDAELVSYHLPRHGFFVDKAPSSKARAAWLERLPEIRIYDPAPFVLPGPVRRFAGLTCIARGDARLARKAELVDGTTVTPLAYKPATGVDRRAERLIKPVGKRTSLIVGRAGSRRVMSNRLGVMTLAIRRGQSAFQQPLATAGDLGTFVSTRRKLVAGQRAPLTPSGRGGRRIVAPVAIRRGYTALKYTDQPGRRADRAPSNVVGRSRVKRAAYTGNWLVDWSRRVPRSTLAPGRRVAASSNAVVASLMGAVADAQAARDSHTLSLSATRRLTYADLASIEAGTVYGQRKKVLPHV